MDCIVAGVNHVSIVVEKLELVNKSRDYCLWCVFVFSVFSTSDG